MTDRGKNPKWKPFNFTKDSVIIIAVTNNKGGVGKTTTTINLATGLAERGHDTLLVDLDPQAHATHCFLDEQPEWSVSDLIMGRPSQAPSTVLATDVPKLDIVPATFGLTETAELLETRIRREERLANALEPLSNDYEHIVIDCPPILGILTYNAIVAADLLLIPVQPGAGAVLGLDTLLNTASELRDEEEVPYRILTTMFEVRTTRTNAMVEELLDKHKRRVLKTVISKSESLNQANLASKPVSMFARSSRGAQEYDELCTDILRLRIKS